MTSHNHFEITEEQLEEARERAEEAELFDEREQRAENEPSSERDIDEFRWALQDLYNQEMEKLENESKTLEEEFREEWEQDVPDWHEFEEASWDVKHTRFAWFLNFLFVAVPYGVFDLFMQIWNVYTNMVDNKLWVGGNLLLVTNTVISLI